MVVLIGFLLLVALVLTRLTNKVNKTSYDLKQALFENLKNKKKIEILESQLYVKAKKSKEIEASEAGRIHPDGR